MIKTLGVNFWVYILIAIAAITGISNEALNVITTNEQYSVMHKACDMVHGTVIEDHMCVLNGKPIFVN
jgi:hypothetical protein